MAQVMNMPLDSLEKPDKSPSATADAVADDDSAPPPPPPPPPSQPQQTLPVRRRDRDSRERMDDRDGDRPRNRRGSGADNYDRNLSPPPRDRERDFKRRRSPSPPYRDRRHSPPRRSSPPLHFKRSRRDDGGYDRRGSPRGGFGPDDRRFGYDYIGGYERMGGRPGYPDEKSHGRFMNRSDWESNRGGYADLLDTGSKQREGLMSYKQFIQELEDDILPAEAERRYQEYRSEYISTQKRAFFDAHKDEEWLKDKYHPTNLLAVIERRNENARRMAKDFLLDLQSGTLDIGPGVNASSSNKSGQTSDPNSDDETETGGKRRRHGRGPIKESDLSTAAVAHPNSSEPRRIQADIEQALALVRKLDSEKGVEDNILCSAEQKKTDSDKSHSGSMGPIIIIRGLASVKGLEGIELLDTILTYLWRIHGLDYYGMVETSEAKGLRHVRAEGKGHEENSKAGADWEKKLDSRWQDRLRGQDPLETMAAKEKIDAAAVEGLDPYVRKIRDERYGWKYGCGAKGCTKLFHAAEFVHKHLKLKHPELVMDLTTKVREDLYFQNYMNDPDAPGGTPVMQQQLLKDRLQRRRPGMDNRLKDDRGNRREHDRIERINDGERFDRTDNSPPHDRQSKGGGLEGGNLDESMYDTYGGKDLGVIPSFPSDMGPPPVLMPVPGAGPLGPFVPAPPEVAMRMLREQGGSSSYEGGRQMRTGPHIGGPAPILGVSSAFRQDPRRLRSYQDLDAPEDEVTVIDYRSL
ncbi:serrate RNA effector molecule-like isoform X2 [Vitis riparia]|uniref:serrate RNA effector molecule-like isoform X2 n=1 Tax=Vitis riparia TaxID=96939 RepID=UPI00155AF335|nr:serrate RNA effector molecule-like isoform X2 [Vitis riparia]